MIEVHARGGDAYEVVVEQGGRTTHTVTVAPDYRDRLTGGQADAEALVRASFEFLLEREPNTSILARFDLPVIASYFPEYESTMRERFAAAG